MIAARWVSRARRASLEPALTPASGPRESGSLNRRSSPSPGQTHCDRREASGANDDVDGCLRLCSKRREAIVSEIDGSSRRILIAGERRPLRPPLVVGVVASAGADPGFRRGGTGWGQRRC